MNSVYGSVILLCMLLLSVINDSSYTGNTLKHSCHLTKSTSNKGGVCDVLNLLLHCFVFCWGFVVVVLFHLVLVVFFFKKSQPI